MLQKIKTFFIPCKENGYRAQLLEGSFLFHFLVFLVVLKLVALSLFLYIPRSAFFAILSKTVLFHLTNQERESLGLGPLREDDSLNEAALLKAQDMLRLDYFGHKSPEGTTPWHWFKETGYDYRKAGENLAIGFVDAEEVFQAWNQSSPHKENITNPYYEDMGIAILKGDFEGKETTLVVQLFGSRLEKPAFVKEAEAKEREELPSLPEEEEIGEEKREEVPEEAKPQVEPAQTPPSFPEDGPEVRFLEFMTVDYFKVIQIIILCSLVLVIAALALSVLVALDAQPKDLLIKAVFFMLIFSIFFLLDKKALLELIPHALNIN